MATLLLGVLAAAGLLVAVVAARYRSAPTDGALSNARGLPGALPFAMLYVVAALLLLAGQAVHAGSAWPRTSLAGAAVVALAVAAVRGLRRRCQSGALGRGSFVALGILILPLMLALMVTVQLVILALGA